MKSFRRLIGVLLSLGLILVLFFVLFNRRQVLDYIVLFNYEPSSEIVALADGSGMNSKARNVFYVYKPSILGRDNFSQYCTDEEETIVLGCYDGERIYVFDVEDERLNGIEEVTAAHEMLHAQYDRLSNKEREQVNSLLERQLESLNDQRIINNIEAYRKKDPSIVLNEAHSIFATEVEILNSELEQYYSKYFIDRKTVVRLSSSYEAVFTDLKRQVDEYDTKLSALKPAIETLESQLTNKADELTNWSLSLEKLKIEGNITEYNSQVFPYNQSVEKYRQDINNLRNKIQEYNRMIELRNNLAMQQNNLYKSIDSTAREL